jgi:superfamily I DNA and/or RNA helicase
VSVSSVLSTSKTRRRRKGEFVNFYSHPLPHHRHLLGLLRCEPSEHIVSTLLRGEEHDNVECIQGPPGTGKTRVLVQRAQETTGRVLLCAPTNVGVANLYTRCLAEGLQDDVSLVLSPDRIPVGTVVLSNDPGRRIVCATISARSGPHLNTQSFDNVFVDEAAQCMEAWIWTLLRSDVIRLVLAGDVKQLPAIVSESGRKLNHQRSLMERLVVDLQYENVVRLTEQHRMAPEIAFFSNKAFYDETLVQGAHAPTSGNVEVHHVDNGIEENVGTSYRNVIEAEVVARIVSTMNDESSVVLLTPYLAQCRQLLTHATHREVHTIDSFQGREADVVILSVVRDGSTGIGFWNEERRLTVALTRARKRLVVVASQARQWSEKSLLKTFLCQVG